MRAFSIKTRLFFYSLLFSFVGLVLVGGYSYFIARKALLERTFNQLTSIREEKGRQVEHFFRDRLRESELAASLSDVKILAENFSGLDNIDINRLKKSPSLNSLISFLNGADCYSSISIGIPNGQIFCIKLASNGDLEHFVYANLNENEVLTNLYIDVVSQQKPLLNDFASGSLLNNYSAFVAAPIFENDEISGVLFLEIPDLALNKLMAERIDEIGLGQTGEVYLAGSDYLMRSSSRFYDNSVLSVHSETFAVQQALSGSSGSARILDYRGIKVLSSYSPLKIPNLHWVVVAEMDWQEALRDITKLKNRIFLIGLVVFTLITGGVFLFSWRITSPLVKLKEAALRVGEGKFDWMLPISQRDEIGLLTQVFNKMTLRLKHTTQRLKEREQRLLHFYRATVDGIMLHKVGKVILVNRALINLTGFNEEELLKTTPENLFADEDFLIRYSNTNEIDSFESILITKNGGNIPIEVQHRRIKYHDQEVEALVLRDISQRKAIEDELKVERLHRLRSVIDGQEQERQRLSRELHDGLGQTLVAIKLRLESIPLDNLGDQKKTIEMVKQMFNQTIEETRRISNNLMPAALTEFSLAVVLRNLCNEFEANSGITISLVVGVLPESLDMLTKTYAYRIAQEALTNIVKHSSASRAVVSVFSDILKLYLHVEDNGVGFNPSKPNDLGNGLYNMKERASLLNGRLEVISAAGKGTKIKAEFPIENLKKSKHEG
jgi:PAS domain S-box-containing protein